MRDSCTRIAMVFTGPFKVFDAIHCLVLQKKLNSKALYKRSCHITDNDLSRNVIVNVFPMFLLFVMCISAYATFTLCSKSLALCAVEVLLCARQCKGRVARVGGSSPSLGHLTLF